MRFPPGRGPADVIASAVNDASRARRCPACHAPLISFEGRMVCPNRISLQATLGLPLGSGAR